MTAQLRAGGTRRDIAARKRQARVALGATVLLVAGMTPAVVTATTAPAGARERGGHVASTFDRERTGVTHPAGLAYSWRTGQLTVAEPTAGPSTPTRLVGLSAFGRRDWSVPVSQGVPDPLLMAFDDTQRRLLWLQPGAQRLVSAAATSSGAVDPSTTESTSARDFGVQRPVGLAVDDTGDAYLLDAAGPRLVRVHPGPGGDFAHPTVTTKDLAWLDGTDVRGLAYDPRSGHLSAMSPSRHSLYELTTDGAQVGTRSLPSTLQDPQGMTFAPSADQTDAPSATSLFVADGGTPSAGTGAIVEVSFDALAASDPAALTSSLLQTVDLAAVSPPSPDPSGLAYLPGSNRLVMTDGEVEETVSGITHFQGANEWDLSLGGSVLRTANLSKVAPATVAMTNEPTGIAWNPNTGHWLVSDDDAQRIYNLNPGPDKLMGTADDSFTYFSTVNGNDNGDPEGVTYDPLHDRIFVADGVNQEIYEYSSTGELVNHFDVAAYGVLDPESVEYNPDSDTLLVLSNHLSRIIVETTRSGGYLRTMDVSADKAWASAGLAYAPASSGNGAKSYYIVDRGIDNNDDPNIVDGKMYEMSAPAPLPPGNLPPSVNAGPDQNIVLPATASLDGTVSDDGKPNPPGTLSTTWSQVSGPGTATFADAAAVDTTATLPIPGTYVLRLRASDGEATVSDDVTVTVTGVSNVTAVDQRISSTADDAEETTTGGMVMDSMKLDMMLDVGVATTTNAMIGLRYPSLAIPPGATIVSAYLQLTATQVQSGPLTLTLQAQSSDDAPALTNAGHDLTFRARTTAAVTWDVPAWLQVNESSSAERSPNLAPVLQEVVSRPGWTATSALALLVTGTGSGVRVAQSYNASATQAALLHVEYSTGAAPANHPPVAGDDTLSTAEDTAGTVNVLTNDTDADGNSLTVVGRTNGAHGTVTCTPGGACTYTPAPNYNGPDSFTYTASDGHGGSDTGTVSVTVTPVNDPPVATANPITTAEDTAASTTVSASDVDGDPLTVSVGTGPAHGMVTCTPAGVCTYTPAPDYNGPDSFTYTVSDGHPGGTTTGTVNVTVTPVNDPPVANPDTLTTAEDVTGSKNVLANDTDADRDALNVTRSTNGAHGTVRCTAAGACTYSPAANYNGPDSFTYTVSDGHGGTATGTVSVTVTPVNDPPVARNDALTTPQGTPGSVAVLGNDSDIEGDTLSVSTKTNGAHGSVTCTTVGVCTYTPAAGYSGSDAFTYTVSDGHGGTATATVTVTVTAAPPPPATRNLAIQQAESADPVPVGSLFAYRFVVTATTGTAVTGGTVVDTLPAGFRVRGVTTTSGACTVAGRTLTCPLGPVAAGSPVTVTVTGAFVVAGAVPNAATVSAPGDATAGDNRADAATTVTGRSCTVVGTFGDDGRLLGTSRADVICGLAGNDRIDARAGNDTVYGNEGTDTVTYAGATRAVRVNLGRSSGAGQGTDTLVSVENVQGSRFADVLTGSNGPNLLSGGRGNDILRGGAGRDVLVGGPGNDQMYGGAGADSCRQGAGRGVARSC